MNELYLPSGYNLPSGHKVTKKLQSGVGWQIFVTSNKSRLLVITGQLVRNNFNNDILSEKSFTSCYIGKELLYLYESEPRYELSHIKYSNVPKDFSEAISFAYAFDATRKIISEIDLSNSIYIEKLSRLLVIGEFTKVTITDDLVLGRWLSGGVSLSAKNIERIKSLSGIGDIGLLNEILLKSGVVKESISLAERDNNFHLIGRSQLQQFLIDHVIDIIENPIFYDKLDIDFPTPFILYGPPGCGKTYAIEQLINYLSLPCFYIESSTVGSPYIHETSRRIAEVFGDAIKQSPSVIVIDEMESFVSCRSNVDAGQYHVEEVNEFLRLIPKAIDNKVLIIGMTNQLNIIDSAIIRKGRFDFCIEVNTPTKREIEELFDHLVFSLPCDLEQGKGDIYDGLYGRQPSDVDFVVKEAKRIAARRRCSLLTTDCFIMAIDKLPELNGKNNNKIGFI
ncbi:ATP-binding protein [Vibrio rumoiensis]|uniref:ATP-binding protein n=1 Tax=Vibrio rumoiensis TaxID=76258 RepID=UPI000B5CFDD5|nr:AAA family ATPase [Vibrio rumoiensis]